MDPACPRLYPLKGTLCLRHIRVPHARAQGSDGPCHPLSSLHHPRLSLSLLATSRQQLPSAHPSVPNLNHLGWLLSIGDNFHLGLALPLAVPDGHGQVPCLVPFQDVGLCTTPGEDVLQRSQTGPSQPVAFVLSPLKNGSPQAVQARRPCQCGA